MERIVPTEAQLHTLVSKHCQANLKTAQVVHHHCNTHVYIALEDTSRIVVRICDGPYWEERDEQIIKFKRERYAWEYLKAVPSIHVPQVIAVETDTAIVPFPCLIMTHLPGVLMGDIFPTLALEEQIKLLEELGTLAHAIHALKIDIADLPSEMVPWDGHDADLRLQLEELTARGQMTSPGRTKVEKLLDRYAPQLAIMDKDIVFLHGDLHFWNILLERNEQFWHISGLVDAELAGAGPRGRELRALEPFAFRHFSIPGMRAAFLRGYGERFGRDEYKLAYLTSELESEFLNQPLLEQIERADCLEDLDWINIFDT
jgi:aminoglycoside phosphotransferase (APT) family kinase protein